MRLDINAKCTCGNALAEASARANGSVANIVVEPCARCLLDERRTALGSIEEIAREKLLKEYAGSVPKCCPKCGV